MRQLKNLILGNDEYEVMLNNYSFKDGIKALGLFVITMIL
jgi:hypothetical protein